MPRVTFNRASRDLVHPQRKKKKKRKKTNIINTRKTSVDGICSVAAVKNCREADKVKGET